MAKAKKPASGSTKDTPPKSSPTEAKRSDNPTPESKSSTSAGTTESAAKPKTAGEDAAKKAPDSAAAKQSTATAKSDPAKPATEAAKPDRAAETATPPKPESSSASKGDSTAAKSSDAGKAAPTPADATAKTHQDSKSRASAAAGAAATATKDATAEKSPTEKTAADKKPDRPSDTAATGQPVSSKAATADSPAPTGAAPKPETTRPDSTPSQPAAQPKRRPIFLPLVLGGALAAGAGFLLSEYDVLELRGTSDVTEMRAMLDQQAQQIAALQEAGEAPAAAPDTAATDALAEEIAALQGSLSTIQDRLTALEDRPVAAGEPAEIDLSPYEDRLAELQANVEAQRGEIEALLDNARSVEEATADAARDATLQTLLTRLTSAVTNGEPYADVLAEMRALEVADLPEPLVAPADTGVVTLNSLQTRFPDAARSALAAARAQDVDPGSEGIGGFLRRQLGARSVAPREGTDPDAILSRAEAAVREARLADALSELEALPDAARADMQEWLNDAQTRQAAVAASRELAQRLTAN